MTVTDLLYFPPPPLRWKSVLGKQLSFHTYTNAKLYRYSIKMQEVGQVGQIEDSVGNRKSILFRIINLNRTSSREPENRESEHEHTSFYQQL